MASIRYGLSGMPFRDCKYTSSTNQNGLFTKLSVKDKLGNLHNRASNESTNSSFTRQLFNEDTNLFEGSATTTNQALHSVQLLLSSLEGYQQYEKILSNIMYLPGLLDVKRSCGKTEDRGTKGENKSSNNIFKKTWKNFSNFFINNLFRSYENSTDSMRVLKNLFGRLSFTRESSTVTTEVQMIPTLITTLLDHLVTTEKTKFCSQTTTRPYGCVCSTPEVNSRYSTKRTVKSDITLKMLTPSQKPYLNRYRTTSRTSTIKVAQTRGHQLSSSFGSKSNDIYKII